MAEVRFVLQKPMRERPRALHFGFKKGAKLVPSWAKLGKVGQKLGQVGAKVSEVEVKLRQLGLSWAKKSQHRSPEPQELPLWKPSWANMEPSWSQKVGQAGHVVGLGSRILF